MRSLRNACFRKLNWRNSAYALPLLFATTAITLPAQTFTTLHSFDVTDGATPYAGLVQATDGNLYGTTYYGGAHNSGTVFKITAAGKLTTLYSFCSQINCADGMSPWAGLIQATDGNLYGTTTNDLVGGGGTVFKITLGGALTTLYRLCSQTNCTDGRQPLAGLVQATDGSFYGTTSDGGNGPQSCGAYGLCGTVFKITSAGALTTLYKFCTQLNCTDGSSPAASLVQVANGDLYGTTQHGGGPHEAGTVYRISTGGNLTTLYNFCSQANCADGDSPQAGLLQATDGNLYGTAPFAGLNGGGSIFKITPTGILTILYDFCPQFNCPDGGGATAGLVQATDGNLYGTNGGGANGFGTAFKITLGGKLTTLYSFCSQTNCTDSGSPQAGLVQSTNGTFYGTTIDGGANGNFPGDGTVFSVSVGLGPFVQTLSGFGRVGSIVKILGTNLTGTTSVTFNGTAAAFKVVSNSLITATVPTGATTGFVTVVAPLGTLISNKKFRVTP